MSEELTPKRGRGRPKGTGGNKRPDRTEAMSVLPSRVIIVDILNIHEDDGWPNVDRRNLPGQRAYRNVSEHLC